MMFGVPAISIAMGMNADKSERKAVMTMFAGAGAVSFLTGVTEPVEFAFMFISPQLYLIHAVFSGVISGITVATGMQLGFGFSAGLIDYAISIPTSLRIIGDAGGFNNAMAGSTG
jgi:phosphotransferase system  glucose/maltose/N-acetylglucosamine-specific IIC component